MSDQQPGEMPSWVDRMPTTGGAIPADAEAKLRRAVAEVMAVQDVTTATQTMPMRFRGTLTMPSEAAFQRLRPLFEAVGHTPHMRHENGMDVIRALPVVFGKEPRKVSRLAIILLIATIISVFFIGMGHSDSMFIDPLTYLTIKITGNPGAIHDAQGRSIFTEHPELIPTDDQARSAALTGVLYTLALLGILGTHEMGHYIMARINKVYTTLPFFIPLPIPPLGTLGAVIVMREPSPNRRVQFDIGIAGPLAGLIVSIPIMFIGLKLSTIGTTAQFLAKFPASIRSQMGIISEGQSLLYLGMKYLVFGQIVPHGNVDVWIHPVAFAAWAGFLVTALNLMPAGQLDGGHVLYGLFGDRARRLRWPLIGVLAVMAVAGLLRENGIIDLGFGWSGWFLWVLIIYFLMRNPAPVLDEITGLDDKRKLLGLATLVIFILIFTPTPLVEGPATAIMHMVQHLLV
jgi:hypothetical protein